MQRQNSQITMDVDEANDENSKKVLDNISSSVPDEPLLGSITTNAMAKEEKGMQIRSSARVFKKMKLEQEQDKKHEDPNHPDASLTSPNSDRPVAGLGTAEKNTEHEVKGQSVRSGGRAVKKGKQDGPNITDAKQKVEIKKEQRQWTYEDKLMFFEAVNEFGKDFDNIQQHINSKLKKRGVPDDQLRSSKIVRNFFKKTFHDVYKHVKFSDGVKKVVQELYGVINYGELYKKLGVITDKGFMRLTELIYRGETCVRVKGKNIRIKTPMCRALVKLNQLDEKYQEVKLPHRVTVELRPKDMTSYVKIQCMAQNPRIKTTLPIQKRLSSLMQCLNKRWRTVDTLNYEKSIISNNPITNEFVPSKDETEEKMQLLMPHLRLSPPQEVKIELPSINISEYFTRQTICLAAYERRLGLDTFTEIKRILAEKRKRTKLDTEPKLEVCDNVKIEPLKPDENEAPTYEPEPDALLADAVHEAVNTILSLQTLDRQQSETSETEELPLKLENIKQETQQKTEPPPPPKMSQEDLEHIENIRKGWTEASSGSLTIGEIYLMYGSDSKLILEYSWVGDEKEEAEKPKKAAANFLEMWNESYEELWENQQRNLTSSLSKLLSLAKLHYRQNTIKCPCGHVCSDKNNKNPLGGPRVRKGTLVDSSINLNPIKQEDNILLTVLPSVPNGKVQNTSSGFRTPMHILPNGPNFQTPTMQQQLSSIQRLKPKFCNRKGRPRQKPIVVERKLPLLPNNLSGHQIVRMSIISQQRPIIPIESKVEPTASTSMIPPQQEPDLQKVITDPEDDNSIISTVPSSPSRILKESDSEWISAEVADYSLSSLLGHLESPIKTSVPMGTLSSNMAADLSSEVDAQLQSLMTESSMDFAANFADLAASVVSDKKF